MTDEIKTLTVSTDKQKREWIELLEIAVQYHNDMAEELKPTIIGGETTPSKFHSGIARAILESIWLLEIWEVEKDKDPYDNVVQNISTDNWHKQKRDEFMGKIK